MTKVLILGANGQIARVATRLFLDTTPAHLTLYLRNAHRLKKLADSNRVRIIEGDVLDQDVLQDAIIGQDVVYANLDGALPRQARNIVTAMTVAKVERLIFVSSMGIYGEVPGEHDQDILRPYRDAAQIIESSSLSYTILRPAWLNNDDDIRYAFTRKDEQFTNARETVSRKSVADLIVKLALTPGLEVRQSLGIHKAI